jgi:dipeptidyl aminopeptidase/acylaminoacyl peptidase
MAGARRQRFVIIALLAIAASVLVQTQSPRPLGIVAMLSLPRLADPQLSPDGREALFTRSEADWKTGRRVFHVWRVPLAGGSAVQLTYGSESDAAPRWSPDGKTIAFTTKRGDDEFAQIYLLPVDGGEARQLTTHASAVANPTWAPDGTAIYFTAPDPKTADEKAREKARDDLYSYDENYKHTRLWKVTLATHAETRLTDGDFTVNSYELSEDGSKIVYHRWPTPLLGDNDRGEVWVMNADGAGGIQLTHNAVPETGATMSPDDSTVIFVSGSNAKFESYYNGRLFTVPAAGGTPRPIVGEHEPLAVDRAMWSKDGKSIYFLANLGVHEELFVVPASGGTPKQLTDGKHAITDWSLRNDRIAMLIGDATHGAELYTMKVGEAAPTRMTHVYDGFTRDFKLGRQESIQWKGADGQTVEGLLTYPVDYQPGRRYPLAVITHGGPEASDKYSVGGLSDEIQVLAGKGYACLQPNYRGSTGYGDAFLRDMVGHYFQNAHLDVMTGVDDVIRRGIADPDQMVKMGWSGGGHMTNKIITFTDRFKAAAAGAGAANWISMYAESDIRFPRTPWFGGTPWQKDAPIDIYWANSPLKDVAKVKTPTIFFVGERDPRVPMPQSIEMYRALKSLGVPTHLYVAPREPHGWGELRHQLSKLNLEIEWFETYATKRPFTPEKAPGEKSDVTLTTDQP